MVHLSKESATALIHKNIADHGHHIYVVSEGNVPRFAYTIGLHKRTGAELVLAGASLFKTSDVVRIINDIARTLLSDTSIAKRPFDFDQLGKFTLCKVDSSWVQLLLLGALDYFDVMTMPALQIRPDAAHFTLDVPDLARPWDAAGEPVWRWLKESWAYPIAKNATAITNFAALRGARITEAARWEVDQWELFAGSGPDTPEEETRSIPIATLLAIDPSLERVLTLDVGKAAWRDSNELEWHDWNSDSRAQ